ncbi:MAG: intradiol ring-cleavage dioxygenase [Acidobacteriota bacterium]
MDKKTSKHLISRRHTLRLLGAAGATALVGWAGEPAKRFLPKTAFGSLTQAQSLSCVVRPALTEGPYFVDEKLNRSDIRLDPTTNVTKTGVPLRLIFNVSRVTGSSCTPLPNAYVDIWHCDALGAYSDVSGAGQSSTIGQKFLRGYQVTDSNGAAQFTTIYPGYYTGRTVHIHFKVRLYSGSQETYEFTSQFFFDDTLTDQVFTNAPYNSKSARGTRNSNDGIYRSAMLLPLNAEGQGYLGIFNIALEGVTVVDPPTAAPTINGASVSGKKLIVTGANFDLGAKIFLNGEKQKKTANDETNPTTILIAKKAGNLIAAGQTVTLQVRNSDNTLSDEFLYARPVE